MRCYMDNSMEQTLDYAGFLTTSALRSIDRSRSSDLRECNLDRDAASEMGFKLFARIYELRVELGCCLGLEEFPPDRELEVYCTYA